MYGMFAQTVKHVPGQVCHICVSAMSNDDGRMSIILALPHANVDARDGFCFTRHHHFRRSAFSFSVSAVFGILFFSEPKLVQEFAKDH